MDTLLFVYGTLKEGFPNFGRNPGVRVPGKFRTRLALPLYVVSLPQEERAPWLIHLPGQGYRVSGQVYRVDSVVLQKMDAFEEVGLPSGYVRVEIELVSSVDETTTLRADAYLKENHQLAGCLSREGPYEEYTPALAVGYRLTTA